MDSFAETSCAEEVIIQHILRYVLLEVDTGHSYKDWLALSLVSRNIDKEGQNLAEIYSVLGGGMMLSFIYVTVAYTADTTQRLHELL